MSRVANDDELVSLDLSDGVRRWIDGSGAEKGATPLISPRPCDAHLWVIRSDDVVHAREDDAAGSKLESKVIKHSNLTGGADAHCGGELLFLDEAVIALNGGVGALWAELRGRNDCRSARVPAVWLWRLVLRF